METAVENKLPNSLSARWAPGLSEKVELQDFNQPKGTPMTDDRLALSELAAKSGDSDFLRTIAEGRVAKLAIGRVEPIITQLSRFVNLLKSEEAPEQIVLIVDGPLAGKSEAFAQPQHRFEPGDRPARRFE